MSISYTDACGASGQSDTGNRVMEIVFVSDAGVTTVVADCYDNV